MAREDLHFRLRIPEDLKQKVEKAAADNHRSMTAEMVARLEDSFDFSGDFDELSTARTLIWRLVDLLDRPVDDTQKRKVEEIARAFLGGVPAKELEMIQSGIWPGVHGAGDVNAHNERFSELEQIVASSTEAALERLAEKFRRLGWTVERPSE
jgi:hypothetical protein